MDDPHAAHFIWTRANADIEGDDSNRLAFFPGRKPRTWFEEQPHPEGDGTVYVEYNTIDVIELPYAMTLDEMADATIDDLEDMGADVNRQEHRE